MAVVDFQYQQGFPLSGNLDKNVGKQMNLRIIPSTLVSEGGAWQTDGEGTMLLVESVELDRNKTLTKKQIENEYKRVLGVEKIIWLKKGCIRRRAGENWKTEYMALVNWRTYR